MSAVSAMTTTLSGRTCRKPPAMAKYSSSPPLPDAQLAEAKSRQAAERGAAGCPAPFDPGTNHGIDLVVEDLPLRRDDLKQQWHSENSHRSGTGGGCETWRPIRAHGDRTRAIHDH